jgi:L-threonylcarbamoyladenylate synthase
METRVLPTDTPQALADAVADGVNLLVAGKCVALPTETVYGLAADALRGEAVAKIFEAKERPFFDPLIVHLPTWDWLERLARVESPIVEKLIEKFWPGPLTLVLPRRDIVPDIVTAGLDTVALRMSAHHVFRAVALQFGKPLAAPSANRFGRISPTTAEHVAKELSGRIPLIVDGGPCMIGIESTVVAVEKGRLRILRAGPVTLEELSAYGEVDFVGASETPEAPGQLKSHYAPRTKTKLLDYGSWILDSPPRQQPQGTLIPEKPSGVAQLRPASPADMPRLAALEQALARTSQNERVGLLAFREAPTCSDLEIVEVLSPEGDLSEAATTLFAKLRRLDEAGLDLILAEGVPEHGLGVAIMDRLRKAAAR